MSDLNHGNAESDAERALRDGLSAPALSAEALQRVRAAAQQEWRASLEGVPARASMRRRWLSLAGAAAATVAVAIGRNVFMTNTSADGAVLGELARADAPGIVEALYLRRDVTLMPGSPLRTRQSLDVRGNSLVTLAGGGNLRVARASAVEVIAANAVKLERGELYVDIP